MKKYFSILMCIVTILTACVPVKTPQATPTATLVSPTPTQQLTLTATLPSTSTPLPTLTATLPPTSTSLPTLPADQAKSQVIELLKTNKGCKLPCWWGITPQQTSWDQAKSFLETFPMQYSLDYFPHSTDFFSEFRFAGDSENLIGLGLSRNEPGSLSSMKMCYNRRQ